MSGAFVFKRGTGTAVGGISSIAVLPERWYYIEVKFNCVNSIGADTFQLRINGNVAINLDASTDMQGTALSGVDEVQLQGVSNYTIFDDLYAVDLTGAVNNDYLGDIKIETLYPDGNGNSSDFVGSDVDSTYNYLHVDDVTQDGDSTYTESDTATEKDLYTFDDLAGTPLSIVGISIECYCRKDDSGSRTGKLISRVNSTDYEGSEFAPGEAFTYRSEIQELNPDDSAVWETADVNGAEFGIKVES